MRGLSIVALLFLALIGVIFVDMAEARRAKPKKPSASRTVLPAYQNFNPNEFILVGIDSEDCQTPQFQTIQDAVDFSDSGDTILVCDGEYYGASVNKELHFAPYAKIRGGNNNNGGGSNPKPPKPKTAPKPANPTETPTGVVSLPGGDSKPKRTRTTIVALEDDDSYNNGPMKNNDAKEQDFNIVLPQQTSTDPTAVVDPTALPEETSAPTPSPTPSPRRRKPKPKKKKKKPAPKSTDSSSSETGGNGGNGNVWIIGGPEQENGGANMDGFRFTEGSDGSSIEYFNFKGIIPTSLEDANLTRAISLQFTSNITIVNNNIVNPRVGIYIESSNNCTIVSNIITNVTDSLLLGGYGIVIVSSEGIDAGGHLIGQNFISFPEQPLGAYPVGIFLSAPGPTQRTGPISNTRILSNTLEFYKAEGNFFGILLFDSGDAKYIHENALQGNQISGCEFGIVLWGASDNEIFGNTVLNVLYTAIRLQQSKTQEAVGNMVRNNTVSINEFGIACVAGTSQNIVTHNTATKSRSPCPFFDYHGNNLFIDNFGDGPTTACHSKQTLYDMVSLKKKKKTKYL